MSYAVRILSAEFSFRFTPAFVERNVVLRQLPVRESFEMRRNSHVQRFATAVFVAGALLVIAFGLRTTVAQDPEDPIPETEYIIQPGEEGYVIVPTPPPDGGVQGDAQHECEDDPLAAECDPAPPTNLRITRSGTALKVHYTTSRWRGSNMHRYRVELHRSSTRGGTYTFNSSGWDNISPEDFAGVSRGYYYKARAKRCRTWNVNDCGEWTAFVGPILVPSVSARAPKPTLTRSGADLKVAYSATGSSKDKYDIRHAGSSSGSFTGFRSETRDLNSVTRDRWYRLRVHRCIDDARENCASASPWSDALFVPSLPQKASGLSLARNRVRVTASFSTRGTGFNRIEVAEREIDSAGNGDVDAANPTGKSHEFTGTRGDEYRFRVSRCTDLGRTDCGEWTDWTNPWFEVPNLPQDAYRLRLDRNGKQVTLSFSATGSGYNRVEFAERTIDSTGDGDVETVDLTGKNRASTGTFGDEYRFRVRRCTDSARTDCGSWTSWTSWTKVLKLATGLSIARETDDLTASYRREGTSHDEIDMNRRLIDASGDGETEVDVDITGTSYIRNDVERGYEYRFRVRRCEDAARTRCGGTDDWSGWSAWKVVPKLATSLGISRDEDDLTASYSREGTTHDVIDMNRRPIGASGVGGTEADGNVTGTRYIRNNVDRGYEYRFRVRRCVDSNRNDCGGDEDWSDWSAWKVVPKLATNLTLSRLKRTLTATYSREGRSYDLIDMDARTIGTTGDGSAEADDDVTGTRFIRRNVDRGDEYRFRVRRCVDSARSEDCGGDDDWSGWSDWVPVPYLPSLAGKPTITVSDDDLTVTYTARGTAHDELLFQQSDSETSGFSNYTGGTLSGKKLSDVDRGKWYRVGVRRCTDSEFTDCTDLSEYSDPKEVVAIGAKLATRADGKSAVASLTLLTGFNYMLQLQSSTSGRNWTSVGASENIASSATSSTYTALTGGSLIYRVQINACTVSRPRVCTNHESNEITLSKAPAPNISRIALANKDDLTVVYTLPSWIDGSGDVYDFEIRRAASATGSFTDYEDADTPPGMPHKFNDVHTGYYYKARARRCSDSALTICGDWSGLSSSVHVPALAVPAPTIRVSLTTTLATVQATFTPGASVRYHVFEVGKSDTQTGTFVYGSTTQTSGTSAVTFSALEIGKWYKVRGKGCEDTDWKRCGAWSYSLDAVEAEGIGVELASRADGKSAIARLTLYSGFNYTLQLQSRAAGGSWPSVGSGATIASSVTSRTYTSLTGGSLIYRARLNACPTGTPSNCTDYNSQEVTLSKAPAPSISSITLANQDDLTVVYTVTAWANGSGDHYDFEIQRAETATGSFADYEDADTPSGMPHKFNNVHTGYHYKARGRRCSDDAATICGDWSGYSSAVNVPALDVQAPTSINVSNPSLAAVRAAFTPGSSVLYHVFEVGKSDTETGSFVYASATNVGARSPVTFSDLEAGKWYKARGKGCEDTDRKRCGAWAYSPDAVRVGGIAVTIGSGADGRSVIASLTLFSGFIYSLQLYGSDNNKDWSDEGRLAFTPRVESTGHRYKELVKEYYRAELSACKPGACVTHRSNTIAISKAPAPNISSIRLANEDDLTVVYTIPNWTNGSGSVLDFKIRRADSATGSFATDYTDADTPSGMPHKFNDVHTGYHYKARARRCSDADLTICGDWSGLSSTVNVPALSAPPAPTSVKVSIVSHVEVKGEFKHSVWPGRDVEPRYAFEVGKSSTEGGTYVYSDGKDVDAGTSVRFEGLETGKWYKVRGKRCYFPARKRCGSWAVSSEAVMTVAPDPKIKTTGSTSILVGAGIPTSIVVEATGLDQTKSYSIKFESSTASSSAAGVLKFSKCDASTMPDSDDADVRAGASSSGKVSRDVFGCQIGVDRLTVRLIEGRNTVGTVRFPFTVHPVPAPTNLRADGDNRGFSDSVEFDIAWKRVDGATSYQLRYGHACSDRKTTCLSSVSTWTNPISVRGSSSPPYSVVIDSPDISFLTLYRVELKTERNGAISEWSPPVYVHPRPSPTGLPIATMSFYGHQSDSEYSFRLCDDSFPDTAKNDHQRWVDEILAGAGSWQESLNWREADHGESRKFVSVVRDETQVDTSTGRDSCPQVRADSLLRLWLLGATFWHFGPVNNSFAEIRFVSRLMLKARCNAHSPNVTGCAPHHNLPASLTSLLHSGNRPIPDDVDVLLHDNQEWMSERGSDEDMCTSLEQTVAHEIGHALGVSGLHSSLSGLLMSPTIPGDVCGPRPYDVAAMLTNYQSLR